MGRGRSQKRLDLVQLANEILEEIQPASVRAVCYQLFIRGLIPSMEKAQTNRVSTLLRDAREEGEIPWEHIAQEGREIESIATWADPEAYARATMMSYRRNKWSGQPSRIIVVSEKGTVRGTLGPVLDQYEVDFLPIGGYASATRVKDLAREGDEDHPLLVLYLGDHDPSGRGMSDHDLPRRLLRYAIDDPDTNRETKDELREASDETVASDLEDHGIEIRRIALDQDDCAALGHDMGFPARDKIKDPRYRGFVQRFGDRCWELDAMNPNDLRDRVTEAIEAELDREEWDRYVTAEKVERESITKTLKTWKSISGLASKCDDDE
jgi:hypothetical protein